MDIDELRETLGEKPDSSRVTRFALLACGHWFKETLPPGMTNLQNDNYRRCGSLVCNPQKLLAVVRYFEVDED